jgi:fibronectin-binding autotransporter adhesin
LKINNAAIDQSVITNSSVTVTTLTSTAGTAGNLLTLTIANGVMTISGTGTQAGNGNVTIDGIMESGELSLIGKAAAPTAPAAGKAFLYYDTTLASIRYNLGGAGWVTIGATPPAGANTELQFNNAGAFGASASLTWNGVILTANALVASNGITVTASGIAVTSGALVLSAGSISASGNLTLGGVTRLDNAGAAFLTAMTMNGVVGYTGTVAGAAGRNVDNGIIV